LARQADLPAIEAIITGAYTPFVRRIGREPAPMRADYAALIQAGTVHVLETDDQVLALIVLIREPEALLLENVAVAPAAQGTGLGSRLLAFAEQAAVQAGYRSIRLYTNAAMTENVALYARRGYVETGRRDEAGFSRVFMAKAVGPPASERIRSCP